MIVVRPLPAPENARNQIRLAVAPFREPLHLLEATADAVRRYRREPPCKAVKHRRRSVRPVIGITDLQVRPCARCHTHIRGMPACVINIPCIGCRHNCHQRHHQRRQRRREPAAKPKRQDGIIWTGWVKVYFNRDSTSFLSICSTAYS